MCASNAFLATRGSFVSEVQTSLRVGGHGCLGGSLGHRIERAYRSHLMSVRIGCGGSCIQMNDQLIPLWIDKTEDIRNDPTSRELLGGGWIADMWGYTIAAAEMGLRHKPCLRHNCVHRVPYGLHARAEFTLISDSTR